MDMKQIIMVLLGVELRTFARRYLTTVLKVVKAKVTSMCPSSLKGVCVYSCNSYIHRIKYKFNT